MPRAVFSLCQRGYSSVLGGISSLWREEFRRSGEPAAMFMAGGRPRTTKVGRGRPRNFSAQPSRVKIGEDRFFRGLVGVTKATVILPTVLMPRVGPFCARNRALIYSITFHGKNQEGKAGFHKKSACPQAGNPEKTKLFPFPPLQTGKPVLSYISFAGH